MPSVYIKRGTRAQLDAAAAASGLNVGEPYLITDEDRIAVGLSASTYETYAKQSEAGGGSSLLHTNGAAVVVANSAAEETLASFTVPGGALGTNGAIQVLLSGTWANTSGSGRTFTLRVKYGATTLFDDASNSMATANTRPVRILLTLFANNSADAQFLDGLVSVGANSATTTGVGDIGSGTLLLAASPISGTASEASGTDKTFQVTLQHSVANQNLSFTLHKVRAWKMPQ